MIYTRARARCGNTTFSTVVIALTLRARTFAHNAPASAHTLIISQLIPRTQFANRAHSPPLTTSTYILAPILVMSLASTKSRHLQQTMQYICLIADINQPGLCNLVYTDMDCEHRRKALHIHAHTAHCMTYHNSTSHHATLYKSSKTHMPHEKHDLCA